MLSLPVSFIYTVNICITESCHKRPFTIV